MNDLTLTRREFLQTAGALVVQASGVLAVGDAAAQAAAPVIVGPHPSALDTWIRIAADGMVTVNSGKMDCGQGLDLAYAQIVADELDVDPSTISDDTRFKEDLEADSLDLYTLVQEFEDTYGTKMSDEEAAEILTVGQAIDFVLAQTSASS